MLLPHKLSSALRSDRRTAFIVHSSNAYILCACITYRLRHVLRSRSDTSYGKEDVVGHEISRQLLDLPRERCGKHERLALPCPRHVLFLKTKIRPRQKQVRRQLARTQTDTCSRKKRYLRKGKKAMYIGAQAILQEQIETRL